MAGAHPIAFRCWNCGKTHSVPTVADHGAAAMTLPVSPLDTCCFEVLSTLARSFGGALLLQMPFHLGRIQARQSNADDALADAAVTSPDPEVRKAAQKWRNERAARKRDEG